MKFDAIIIIQIQIQISPKLVTHSLLNKEIDVMTKTDRGLTGFKHNCKIKKSII